MKKNVLVLFCILTLLVSTVPAAALEGEALRSADMLATLNLVNGDNQGNYALESPASRAQATVLLVRLSGAESIAKKAAQSTSFRDLPSWARSEIIYAAQQGWAYGASATSFNPNETITACIFCVFYRKLNVLIFCICNILFCKKFGAKCD